MFISTISGSIVQTLLKLTPWLVIGLIFVLAALVVVHSISRRLRGQPTGCANCSKTDCLTCQTTLIKQLEDSDAQKGKAVTLK